MIRSWFEQTKAASSKRRGNKLYLISGLTGGRGGNGEGFKKLKSPEQVETGNFELLLPLVLHSIVVVN
jgi:hypothetical protein